MDAFSIVIAVLVVGFLVWALIRLSRRSTNPPKLQLAMELIANINDDIKILTQKKNDPQSLKKFKLGNWSSYKEHLDFIEKDSVAALDVSFKQMMEYNAAVDASRTTAAPPPVLETDTLAAPLMKGRAGLATWIRDNIGKESARGIFSWR